MFSKEVITLLKNVLLSWEVLLITIVLILYFYLIFYVARLHRKPPSLVFAKKTKKIKKAEPELAPEPEDDDDF
ncbi:hypothetical protein MASR2M78_28670 [Treponema sp.]